MKKASKLESLDAENKSLEDQMFDRWQRHPSKIKTLETQMFHKLQRSPFYIKHYDADWAIDNWDLDVIEGVLSTLTLPGRDKSADLTKSFKELLLACSRKKDRP